MQQKINIRILGFVQEKVFVFSILTLFIGVVPAFIHNQWLTGPFVNALLILACVLVGPMEAVVLGLFPSTVALSSGLLPLPLAPMIPFIMISNALFVATFYYINKKNFFLAVLVSAFLKFLFLLSFSTFLAQNLFAETFLSKVAILMSWPQLATALLGGVFAYAVLKFLKKA